MRFVGGDFLETTPKEYQFLEPYFPTEKSLAFLRYFSVFRNTRKLAEHTGVDISYKFCLILRKRFNVLVALRQEAKEKEDLEKLAEIDSGRLLLRKYNLTRHPIKRDRTKDYRKLSMRKPDFF